GGVKPVKTMSVRSKPSRATDPAGHGHETRDRRKESHWRLERLTNERVVVDLNPGSRRASRGCRHTSTDTDGQFGHGMLNPMWIGDVLGRKALGVTSRARKTGPDTAMIVEDVSIIAALARRVSGTRTSIARHQIRALS